MTGWNRRGMLLLLAMLVACFLTLGVVQPAVAQEPILSPAEAVALGDQSDGATIGVRGEAIGEVLRDGTSGSWLNVLDDGTGIGLWGEAELFEVVEEFGDYHQRGQIVEAIGTYNSACNRHGGDRDIHVTRLRVVEPAEPIERPFHWWKVVAGLVLFALSGALWNWRRTHVDWSL